MFSTTDINLTAFLSLKGFHFEMNRNFNKVEFIFKTENEAQIKENIKKYYNNELKILEYSNILRNIKSQIANTCRKE